ncbi:MAG: hypothetical protein APF83_12360 [Lutibacter sp. BRH_c52]|nr:MAG: hypothetical protein APF83_12360 [Lutibacter sp. BRH_c52]
MSPKTKVETGNRNQSTPIREVQILKVDYWQLKTAFEEQNVLEYCNKLGLKPHRGDLFVKNLIGQQ